MEIGKEFEQIIGELYSRMGYDVEIGKLIKGASNAVHQVDVYAEKRGILGKKTVLIECKYRYNEVIGKPEVAKFLLTLNDLEAKEGHIVTNSSFSEDARNVAESYNITLIDGNGSNRLFEEYGMGDCTRMLNAPKDPLTYIVRSAIDVIEGTGILKNILRL